MAALISQVSSNQKEKWKNNVNIISSYNGPASLLSQLHRALNISNVYEVNYLLIQTLGAYYVPATV